jgi:hypothetical protein
MSYDRRHLVAAIKDGPAGRALWEGWNSMHDIENALESAMHEYDVASSYRGYPGERDAKAMVDRIKSLHRELEDLTMKKFQALVDAEERFIRKHGRPDDYADNVRRQIYPR